MCGLDSASLYPDYWNDVNIKTCPSDPRSDFSDTYGWWTTDKGSFPNFTEKDIQEYVKYIRDDTSTKGTDEAEEACLHSVLSFPVSYLYVPYACQTSSQVGAMFRMSMRGTTIDTTTISTANVAAAGCPKNWKYGIVHFPHHGAEDLTIPSTYDQYVDADGSPLPKSIHRLREGVERFFITDINNPASGSVGQSTLAVMWDAWGNSLNSLANMSSGIVAFNHSPGGSNVLYMDGHVSWVRFGSGHPVWNEPQPSNGKVNLAIDMSRDMWAMGGMG